MRRAWLLALAVLSACSDNFLVVTVDVRPSVHGATQLAITLSADGSTRTDTRTLGTHVFPVTFAIDAGDKSGDLAISIDALDDNMQLVGQGSAQTTLAATAASITLDSADFVVNTDFAGDQELTTDYEAVGLQLASAADDSWTVTFHGPCSTNCDMLGRRFDANGSPLTSAVAAGTNQFPVTTEQADTSSTTAAAGSGSDVMVVWDFSDASGDGVACEHLDSTGAVLPSQQSIGSDSLSDVVSATALPNGKFAVTWDALLNENVIRGVIVDTTCTPVGAVTTISQNGMNTFSSRAQVAANGSNLLYAWVQDTSVHIRTTDATNTPTTNDTQFLVGTDTEQVQHVRVTNMGNGFAIAVRWANLGDDTMPGHIDLYRVNAMGVTMGPPTIITQKAGSDFNSVEAFGLATRADGAVLVVWHACGDNGDGDGCGVFGRIVRPTGVPVGDPFVLSTTTKADQIRPSAVGLGSAFAVAWDDQSQQAPDVSGFAVRARVIYPLYDDATSVLGAPCGDGNACGAGLICVPGSDSTPRCYEDCDPTQPPPVCPNGGTCMMGGCTF